MKHTLIALAISSLSAGAIACNSCQVNSVGAGAQGSVSNYVSASSVAAFNGSSHSGAGQTSSVEVDAFAARTKITGGSITADREVSFPARGVVQVNTVFGVTRTDGTVVESGASASINTEGYAYNLSRGFATGSALAEGQGYAMVGAGGSVYDYCHDLSAGYYVYGESSVGNIEAVGRNAIQMGGASADISVGGIAGVQHTSGFLVDNTTTLSFRFPATLSSVTQSTTFEANSAFAADSKQVSTDAWQFGLGWQRLGLSGASADAYGSASAYVQSGDYNWWWWYPSAY